MTPEQEKEYDNYCEMFGTVGWKEFIKGLTDIEEVVLKASIDSATINDQWQFLRGQITQIRTIKGFEAYVEALYQQMLDDDKEELDEDSG